MRVGNLPGIRRLPIYVDILRRFQADGIKTTSLAALAEQASLVVSVVRKDIEMTGAAGKNGVGFATDSLIKDIEGFLGWDNPFDAFFVGAGDLGSAIIGYEGFRRHGLNIVAAFDNDPEKIGKHVHDVEIFPVEKLESLAKRLHIGIGVITVPSNQAQFIADLLVRAGVTRIWSFATQLLTVPATVTVQREDLSAGLAELLVRSADRSTN